MAEQLRRFVMGDPQSLRQVLTKALRFDAAIAEVVHKPDD